MITYSLLQLVDGGFLLLSTYSLHAENSMHTHWKNANFKIKFYLSNIFNKVCARALSGAHASEGKASQPKSNSYIYMCVRARARACVYAPSPKGGKASRPKLNSTFSARAHMCVCPFTKGRPSCVYAPSPKGGKASRPKLNSNFRTP